MLSLAVAQWKLLFKLKVSVEQEEGGYPAPRPLQPLGFLFSSVWAAEI